MSETKRTILITGCSSGCGLDAAYTLRERGWRVFASCRKPEDCEKLISEGFESPQLVSRATALPPAHEAALSACN